MTISVGLVPAALFSASPPAKSIVVLGDSISAGYGIPVENSWVALLQQKLDQNNQPYSIANESISGDTTAGGLARINKILDRGKPEILILELGGNDGMRGLSPHIIKNNMLEIINRSKQAGAQVLLLSMRIPPNYGKRYTELFYDIYAQVAEETDVLFVPFLLEDVALNEDMMQSDGIHPNEKGQPVIAEKIWQYLKPVLNSQ